MRVASGAAANKISWDDHRRMLDLLVDTVRKLKRANRGAQALKAHRMIASLTAPRRKRGVAGAIRRILRRSLRGDAGDARRGHR